MSRATTQVLPTPTNDLPSPLLKSALAAAQNRSSRDDLKMLQDECGDFNIVGPSGSSITEWGADGLLLATILTGKPTEHLWLSIHRQAKSLGCQIRQNGSIEGSFTFSPDDPAQSKFAFKEVGRKQARERPN